MYYLAIRQFARTLRNLDAVLEKATKYAEARKFDVNNFLQQRPQLGTPAGVAQRCAGTHRHQVVGPWKGPLGGGAARGQHGEPQEQRCDRSWQAPHCTGANRCPVRIRRP